jgi:hypothetical protein
MFDPSSPHLSIPVSDGLPSQASTAPGSFEEIELLGPHLRVRGRLAVGRFNRLSDLVNHSDGYFLLRDAQLLRRDGESVGGLLPELMVNQDEITFIGQAAPIQDGAEGGRDVLVGDRPTVEKEPRPFVVFTPGHVISGIVHVHPHTTLATFVDTTDPRFVPMTRVRVQSLAEWQSISHFELLLVNRTQMTAVAEDRPAPDAGGTAEKSSVVRAIDLRTPVDTLDGTRGAA